MADNHKIGIPVVRPVAVPVMHFHDVFYHEAQPRVHNSSFVASTA
jgi:hypothetical protein